MTSLRLPGAWGALRIGFGALLVLGPSWLAPAQGQTRFWIELTPSQTELVADGKSQIRITATVRDRAGNMVDGQEVVFNTDKGHLSLDATLGAQTIQTQTENGVAAVFLVSAETGQTTVRASAGNDRAEVDIDLVPETTGEEAGDDVVILEGDWVGYSLDRNVIEAVGNARLTYRGLRIDARDWIKVDVRDDVAQALGAKLTVGEATLQADRVFYDFRARKGAFERVTESAGAESKVFSGRTLELADDSELSLLSPDAFRPIETDETLSWVVASRAMLFRGKKVALRHAQFHVGGKHLVTLPYHVVWLGLGGREAQTLNISSATGLAMDLPFYVSVTARQTTSVRLRRGRVGDWFSARPGWSAAIRQDYEVGEDLIGSVEINGLTQSDWGMSWSHRQQYTPTLNGYFSVRYPAHRALLGDISLYSYNRERTISFRSSFDKFQGGGFATRNSVDWLMRGRPLGKSGLQYRLGNRMALMTGGPLGTNFSDQVSVGLFAPAWQLDERTSARPRIDYYLGWDSRGTNLRLLRGELAIDRRVGSNANLALRYTYDQQRSSAYSIPVRQQIGFNLSAGDYRNWYSFISGSYDLRGNGFYAYGSLNRRLHDKYSLELLANYYRFGSGSFHDTQIGVARRIAGRDLAIRWSEARHRFWLELGGTSF